MNRLREPLSRLAAGPLGDWQPLLSAWCASPEGARCLAAVDARLAAGAVVYPAEVFRALRLTPMAATRVVILGQDPYHGAGQAEGLAFSVADGVPPPPSLRNIFKELQRDLGLPAPRSGCLRRWAEQGVLLLNTSLTVEDGQAASHARLGWATLADTLVAALAADAQPKVFMLWGGHAQQRMAVIEKAWHGQAAWPHRVLACNHPSPLSAARPPAPFLGCGHFGQAARFLREAGRGELDWSLGAHVAQPGGK